MTNPTNIPPATSPSKPMSKEEIAEHTIAFYDAVNAMAKFCPGKLKALRLVAEGMLKAEEPAQ